MDQAKIDQLVRTGLDALRAGNSAFAISKIEEAVAQKGDVFDYWLLLAQAQRHHGDRPAEIAALNAALKIQSGNVMALLMMGDAKAAIHDDRAAISFYQSAIRFAQLSDDIPAALHPALDRAVAWIQTAQQRFADYFHHDLKQHGLDGGQSPRISQAIDLLLGDKQRYAQQPTVFYLPELAPRQFYEREEFEWVAAIEAQVPIMQEELAMVRAQQAPFEPYIMSTEERPQSINPLAGSNKWGAYYFWRNGERVESGASLCPITMEALNLAPMPVVANRSPMALYSVLEPNTHIVPHHGALNTRLICHIPLVVPGDCALRCGNETRAWEEGKALIFDDSIEHEAWNRSDQTRIVLLFDFWKPEIEQSERDALAKIFEIVDHYSPLEDG